MYILGLPCPNPRCRYKHQCPWCNQQHTAHQCNMARRNIADGSCYTPGGWADFHNRSPRSDCRNHSFAVSRPALDNQQQNYRHKQFWLQHLEMGVNCLKVMTHNCSVVSNHSYQLSNLKNYSSITTGFRGNIIPFLHVPASRLINQ